jgi:hypothetical protein
LRAICLALVTSLALVFTGCGGSNTSSQTSELTLTAGNWDFAAASSSGTNFLIGGNVVQNGTGITGGLRVSNSACIPFNIPVPISGNISGQTATVTSAPVSSQIINATLSGSATSLTGTYSVAGTGCAGGDKGSIAGVLVPSITGTWKGTLVSNVSNSTITLTAPITEVGADATGLFGLTGSAAYTGATCFTSGSIIAANSSIAGRTIHIIFSNNDGSNVDLFAAPVNPASPTTITGTYVLLGGVCSDMGTFTMTKQ